MTYLVVKHNIMKSVIWRLNANCLYCSRLQQVGNISYQYASLRHTVGILRQSR